MQLAVRHNLQIFDPGEGTAVDEIQDDANAIVLPMNEAVAVMGETIAAFLVRVAWRFDLPTVCQINGEYQPRAEWETRALAANENLEFTTRPLGAGSGSSPAKSIGAIVAMLALTAVAGPLGGLVSGAIGGGFLGAVGGALASAVIVGAGAVPIVQWTAPPVPRWRSMLLAARDSLKGILAIAVRFWEPVR